MREGSLDVVQLQNKNDTAKRILPPVYPFVKWAGGKTQLLQQLHECIPDHFDRYFEPFLGGGALFFYLISMKSNKFKAYLSDINFELVNSYNVVKSNVEELIGLLNQHERGFTDKDQSDIANIFAELTRRKCKVMLSNSNTPLIRELYSKLAQDIKEVKAIRAINSKGSGRIGHTDLIIRNYS